MTISFLGTNGWYSSSTGDTPCVVLDTKDHYVVFDAGNGLYKIDQYLIENKPISLFISHFHIDHTSGLHILNKFNFPQGIDVYVGPNRKKDFETLVNPPFTVGYAPRPDNITTLATPIRLHELLTDGITSPFTVKPFELFHAYTDHGFRLELEGKTIAYTGDCGLSDSLNDLVKDVDVLISECATKKSNDPDIWGHLDPTQAAAVAKENSVKKLLLTHFGANTYLTHDDRVWAENEAKKIFSDTTAAYDGMKLEV